MKDFTATISGNSDRAESWRKVFGSNTIHLKSPLPTLVNLPGKPGELVYELDLDLLTQEQRDNLIRHISVTFGIVESLVARDLAELGCPILAEDITITVYNPQRWLD